MMISMVRIYRGLDQIFWTDLGPGTPFYMLISCGVLILRMLVGLGNGQDLISIRWCGTWLEDVVLLYNVRSTRGQ